MTYLSQKKGLLALSLLMFSSACSIPKTASDFYKDIHLGFTSSRSVEQHYSSEANRHPEFLDVTYKSGGVSVSKTAEIVEDYLVIEGDIIIGKTEDYIDRDLGLRAAINIEEGKRWSNEGIPYVIASNHPNKTMIEQAIQDISATTGLCLTARSSQSDYVKFVEPNSPNTCSSWIGKVGGEQSINIGQNCSLGSIKHEILHAAGTYHEQSRSDRDNHIQINWSNIQSGKEHNFDKYPVNAGLDIGAYDYGSIMHYPRWAFAINANVDTITPLDPNEEIGQRDDLSPGDIRGVNHRYNGECNSSFKTSAKDGDYWFNTSSSISTPVVGDFDNDSYIDDIVYHGKCGNSSSDCWRAHIGNITGMATRNMGADMWFAQSGLVSTPISGDFDNDDHIDDIVYYGKCGNSSSNCWRAHLSNGTNFSVKNMGADMWFNSPFSLPVSGDFDNDSYIDDIVYHGKCGNSGGDCWRAHFSDGANFSVTNMGGDMWYGSNSLTLNPPAMLSAPVVGDFDNDSFIDDILYFGKCGNSGENCWRAHLSDGSTFSTVSMGGDMWFGGTGPNFRLISGDFDDDSFVDDIAYYGKCGAVGVKCWRVHLGDGSSLKASNYGDNAWFKSNTLPHSPISIDVNNDGFQNEVIYAGRCGSGVDCWRNHTYDP